MRHPFDSFGELCLWRLCGRWGNEHTYWRIPESPNGICLKCGHIAQDIMHKVRLHAEYRRGREKWESQERRCAVCNEPVEWDRWWRSRMIFDGAVACGYQHRDKYIRIYLMSFDPDLDGTREKLPVGWTWSSMRRLALERDNHTCQNCGAEKGIIEVQNKWNPDYPHERSNLDVHHIRERSLGGSDHPKNLITLCFDCHKKTFRKRHRIAMIERTKCKSLETYE